MHKYQWHKAIVGPISLANRVSRDGFNFMHADGRRSWKRNKIAEVHIRGPSSEVPLMEGQYQSRDRC